MIDKCLKITIFLGSLDAGFFYRTEKYCLGICNVMVKLGVLGIFWAGKIGEMLSIPYFLKKKISFFPNLINDHDHHHPPSSWGYKKMLADVQWIQLPFCVHCVYTLFFILLIILWVLLQFSFSRWGKWYTKSPSTCQSLSWQSQVS